MDNRKIVKEFINCMCNWVECEHKEMEHDGFIESVNDGKISYLLKDKGIEKRIQKQLFKRLNLKSAVKYEYYPVGYGKLYIKILKDEYIPMIQFPIAIKEKNEQFEREYLGEWGRDNDKI